ncbi:hypothetical protein SME41J_48400 (plasmid) [Serratia marcescens]|nr:hypothetical protein SME41J_48400 [Serratia marcescens]
MSDLEFYILLSTGLFRHLCKKITIFKTIRNSAYDLLFRYIDYRVIIYISVRASRLLNKNYGLNESYRQTHFNILGFHSATTHHVCVIRQRILKRALIHENKQLLKQLERCADEIRNFLHDKNLSGQVIFAPLHTVSDVMQTVIAALVNKKPVVVVSVHDAIPELDTKQNNNRQGIFIEQFSPEAMQGNTGSEFHDVIYSLLSSQKNLVIFPDALPECTTRFAKKKMKTYPVILHGKNCELHTGLPFFSRLLKQKSLFYSIRLDRINNIRLSVLGCVDQQNVEREMPGLIENGISRNHNDWILWHYTSFFCYNF